MTQTIIADPQDIADYAFEFAPMLVAGETISEKDVTVPTDLTLTPAGKPPPAIAGSQVVCWISGGALGSSYDCVCHITTSAARQYDLTMRLKIRNR